ncbi:hypothetical protein MPNT_50158 [Candidatus Methylacidithermus pantelleriae]|uniref:Uncharacterized protein n=1 Tax=Candidatus Methylacidithermus pantelleriae TaxID=2744239 RepID=A0A8J2FTJ3_9BACT|nr:hypothetical protein MPNT_50158 [Candidatus Methylacidithermus pantelleriae]
MLTFRLGQLERGKLQIAKEQVSFPSDSVGRKLGRIGRHYQHFFSADTLLGFYALLF